MNPQLAALLIGGGVIAVGLFFLLPRAERSPNAELEAVGNPDVLVGLNEVGEHQGPGGRSPLLIPAAIALGVGGGIILLQRRS